MDFLIISGTSPILASALAVALLALATAQRAERERHLAHVATRRRASMR